MEDLLIVMLSCCINVALIFILPIKRWKKEWMDAVGWAALHMKHK